MSDWDCFDIFDETVVYKYYIVSLKRGITA